MRGLDRTGAAIAIALTAVVAFIVFLPELLVLGSALPASCYTEILGKASNLSGYDFEISDTTCKSFASDDAITIFASQPGDAKKTALFKYDPGNTDLPMIQSIDAHTVRISVRAVSSIFFSEDHWQDLSVEYDIGEIQYSGKNDPPVPHRPLR